MIDDHPHMRELSRYLLARAGHRVLLCARGEDGLAIAAREKPDLVLIDLNLPGGIDGYETMRRMPAGTRAVAFTAYPGEILAAGFAGRIDKAVRSETFVDQVEAFLPTGAAAR